MLLLQNTLVFESAIRTASSIRIHFNGSLFISQSHTHSLMFYILLFYVHFTFIPYLSLGTDHDAKIKIWNVNIIKT